MVGFGVGRVVRWARSPVCRYVQARTGKGNIGVELVRLGRGDSFCCLYAGGSVETGGHLVFNCKGTPESLWRA